MRIIGHLDMDAFFASIEERDRPRLRGLPIVVGADPEDGRGRGVVSTANYKAREYGIRSALPISAAWKFSEAARRRGLPPAVFFTVSMGKYGEESEKIMEIVRRHLASISHGHALVEQASVDEAYFDVSSAGSYDAAVVVAQNIKRAIKVERGLTASVGIGPNKLIAKIASDREKPDGFTLVRAEDAEAFLEPLSLRTIPGVGPKAEEKFKTLGVRTVRDAKKFSAVQMQEMMGKWGAELYERLRARDENELVESWEAKSIGEQETFAHDTLDAAFLTERLQAVAASVYERFAESGFSSFRSVTITVRFSDFKTLTRASTLAAPVARAAGHAARAAIEFEAMRLFIPFLDRRENPSRKAIRLVGVRVEKLA